MSDLIFQSEASLVDVSTIDLYFVLLHSHSDLRVATNNLFLAQCGNPHLTPSQCNVMYRKLSTLRC